MIGCKQRFLLAAVILLASEPAAAGTHIQGEAGRQMYLLLDSMGWLILAAGFLGLLLGAVQERIDPFIRGRLVFRHDLAARLSHWTHAVGCMLLLASGTSLGLFFIPRQTAGPLDTARILDLHFLGALFFVFGGFYWLANTIISPWRFREHMPNRGSLREGITHYAHILGLTDQTVRPEKYDGSERLAFVPIVLFAALLILSGFIKLAARLLPVGDGLLSGATWLHDVSALVMLVLFFFHVLLAAVVPWSWPLLRSMFTGHLPLDFVKKHHQLWYEQLTRTISEEEQ